LGSEGGPEGVDLAVRHGAGLGVQLARLGQVRLVLIEQVDLEQVGGAFNRGGHEERRVEADEVALAVEVVHRALYFVADAQYGPRPAVAQVEVSVIEEEVGAVLLGGYWVLGTVADDLHAVHGELHAAGGALVRAHGAGD